MAAVGSATNTTGSTPTLTNPKSNLSSSDFINLLVTQLQNQDPMDPMKNSELLQQVSQIGSLQSQNNLNTSLKSMLSQNQLTAASAMIGKFVAGKNPTNGEDITGVVTSVKVEDDAVKLELDNGQQLDMANVTGVTTVDLATGAAAAG